jgi:hypothetical protein
MPAVTSVVLWTSCINEETSRGRLGIAKYLKPQEWLQQLCHTAPVLVLVCCLVDSTGCVSTCAALLHSVPAIQATNQKLINAKSTALMYQAGGTRSARTVLQAGSCTSPAAIGHASLVCIISSTGWPFCLGNKNNNWQWVRLPGTLRSWVYHCC